MSVISRKHSGFTVLRLDCGLGAGSKEWSKCLVRPLRSDLLAKSPGSDPFAGASQSRIYDRHWTPVHLDFVVADVEAAVQRAQAVGAQLEGRIHVHKWGRIANMADPFGHGLCLIEFTGRGYDEILCA